MKNIINVTQSSMPDFDDYTKLIKKLWETKKLTNRGDYVIELENSIQNYLRSTAKPLLVCNGTMALQLAIRALDLRGEIITTPFSYVATTSTIVWENCKPIFVDIHPNYLTIDETKIEAAITKNTSAILATHVYGNPCDVEAIDRIAKKHKLKVVYDAAHCFGVQYKKKSIFDYGDVSTCSFHATKIFHTVEGGGVFCRDNKLKQKINYYHNFGHLTPISFNGIGINGKINEFNAAIGLSLLPHLDQILLKRENIVNYYNINLNFNPINQFKLRKEAKWNFIYYPLLFKNEKQLLKIEKILNDNHIYPRRYFYPSLNNLPYVNSVKMPISEDISKRVLCLPLYRNLKTTDLKKIVGIINQNK